MSRALGKQAEDRVLRDGESWASVDIIRTSHTENTIGVVWLVTVVLCAALCLAGCAEEPVSSAIEGEILVSAAASLTTAFGAIESAFEDATPGADVVLNLAGSSSLREQILQGAPVDVFASANTENMDLVVEAGGVSGQPAVFALNQLQIAVPPGNPAGVSGLVDFGDEALFIGLCAEGVPCGDFAREALAKAGVRPQIDTEEPDVRALLTKVGAGELDAGIIYVTDVVSASGGVDPVDIPDEENVVAEYQLATLSSATHPALASLFVEFVLSDAGQQILADHGFVRP